MGWTNRTTTGKVTRVRKVIFRIYSSNTTVIDVSYYINNSMHATIYKIYLLCFLFIYDHPIKEGWIVWGGRISQHFKPHPVSLFSRIFTLLCMFVLMNVEIKAAISTCIFLFFPHFISPPLWKLFLKRWFTFFSKWAICYTKVRWIRIFFPKDCKENKNIQLKISCFQSIFNRNGCLYHRFGIPPRDSPR